MKSLVRGTSNVSKALLFLGVWFGAVTLADEPTEVTFFSNAKTWLNPAGSLRLAYFDQDAQFSGQEQLLTGASWLSLRPEAVAGIRTFVEARFVAPNLRKKIDGSFDLREGYLETSFGPIDIRAGRQVIVWGRADKLNPTDSLTTKALTLLTTDDEEQRLGVGSLQVTYNFEGFRLIGVWQPEWRRPLYPIPRLSGITLEERDPSQSWKQMALKLDASGGKVDWSLSYFNGFNRTPDLKFLSAGPSGVELGLIHQRIQVYGGDAATAIGPVGLRAEASYTQTTDDSAAGKGAQKPFFYGVLGSEYSPFENVTLFGQYLYRHIFNFVDPSGISDPNASLIATQINLISNQVLENEHGFSLRVAHKAFHETLESEVTFLMYLQGGGWLVRPKVTYAISDSWRILGGMQFYGGGTNTFLGRLKDLSTSFAEIRWLF